MKKLLLGLLILSLTSYTGAQQNYSGNSALDCDVNDEAGPSPAFLYTCNGQHRSCQSFLIFKSETLHDSVPAIAALTSADTEELAKINNVTKLYEFPINQEVIVPVNCSCSGQYYQANTTFHVTSTHGTYYVIANDAYEGLSTCASLIRANQYDKSDLQLGTELQVPLRCACPTKNQVSNGTRFLLTYPLGFDDDVYGVAERFKVNAKSVLEANGMGENSDLSPETTILIPLLTRPTSSQTIFRSNTTETSPPPQISPPVSRRQNRKLYERVLIAAGCSLLVLSMILVVIFLFVKKSRQKDSRIGSRVKQLLPEDLRVEIASFEQVLRVFGIEEVKKATENFSSDHMIKGSVYCGDFDGEKIAVKKTSQDASKQVDILKRINHFNLIQLHGVCENQGSFYLVFEYMQNGSLREWLYGKGAKGVGSWNRRIQIALDVASGLHYLHSFTEPAYVHKDIKSSNVLLNSNLRAKIANFSLARAAAKETADAIQTEHVVGTRGYMAPEYLKSGQVTPKIDVYAYGVVLLELITGKDAIFVRDGKEQLLSTAILSIMEKENAQAELGFWVDPRLTGSNGTEFAFRLAKISAACLAKETARRPSMEEVVSNLLKIQADLHRSQSMDVEPVHEE